MDNETLQVIRNRTSLRTYDAAPVSYTHLQNHSLVYITLIHIRNQKAFLLWH